MTINPFNQQIIFKVEECISNYQAKYRLLNQVHVDCGMVCLVLEIAGLRIGRVCLCVCLHPKPLITSGMIWCDIDGV